MSKFKIIYTILLIFALGLFFGIFFGLGYPEIQRAEYVSTECAIDDKTILSKYCCYKECSTCETASASAPTCTALESQWNSLSPETCGNAVLSNSSLTNVCPINDLKGECDDGYYCCSECCSTCTSCSTSCSGTGSGSSCSTSCTSYSCNCACCSSTNNHSCQIKCPICYSVVLKVTYHDSSYKPITTNITTEYREDLNGAEQFLAKYRVSSTVRCFYNPKNTSQALLFIDYAVKNWVAIGITASFLTIILMYGTWYLFKNNTTIFQGYKYRILMMEIALWCGTIIPPLLVLIDFIPFTNGKILWTLAVIGVTIGWTPIHTIACMKTRGWSFISAFTVTTITFILPLIMFSIFAIYTPNMHIHTSMLILAIIIPLGINIIMFLLWDFCVVKCRPILILLLI